MNKQEGIKLIREIIALSPEDAARGNFHLSEQNIATRDSIIFFCDMLKTCIEFVESLFGRLCDYSDDELFKRKIVAGGLTNVLISCDTLDWGFTMNIIPNILINIRKYGGLLMDEYEQKHAAINELLPLPIAEEVIEHM